MHTNTNAFLEAEKVMLPFIPPDRNNLLEENQKLKEEITGLKTQLVNILNVQC